MALPPQSALFSSPLEVIVTQELYDLITSKRFWAAFAALLVIIVQQWFPNVSADFVNNIVMVISAWILSVAVRPSSTAPAPPAVVVVPPATGVFPAP